MADDIANLGFSVDTSGLRRGETALNSYATTGEKTERRTGESTSGMGMSYTALAGVIGTVTTAALSLKSIVSSSREFDILNAQLITATGSAENAATAFSAIQKFAATTPYDLAQATEGFTQLVNLGLTPSEAAMESYGNTASAMGKDLSQMIEAVADATTGEFERLKEFGIKSKSEGDNVSFTFRGVTKTVKKEAASIEGYLMALGENEFAGAMAERAATLDGAISNMDDTLSNLSLTLSQQGGADIMQDSVRSLTEEIQALDDYIASGAMANSLDALSGRFDNFINDISLSLNMASALIGNSTDGWSESIEGFFDNMTSGFKQLPEMTRFFIQLTAVNIGRLVDYAAIYGDAFVEVMSLRFDSMVEEAKIAGQKIASAVNPFADEFDYTSASNSLTEELEAQEAAVMASAEARIAIADEVTESLVNGYALEAAAATSSYEKQIEASNKLLEAYRKEKSSTSGDQLAEFKIEAEGAASAVETVGSEYQKWIDDVTSDSNMGRLQSLQDEIINVYMAMDMGDLDPTAGLEYIKKMESEIESLKSTVDDENAFGVITDSAIDGLSAIQGLSAQGSKDYAKLGIAIQAVTAAQRVQQAVASASLATVTGGITAALSLVSMLDSAFGGEIETTFEYNQSIQGLDIWGDKSQAIANSVDITASATNDLVGINTEMLTALNALSGNLDNVAAMTIKGLENVDVGNLGGDLLSPVMTTIFNFMGAGLGSLISKFFGGSSKTTDMGVSIGGSFADSTIGGYQETKYKNWRWGSTHTQMDYYDMGDEISDQFSLALNGIADSVYEASMILGLTDSEVTDAINSFEIATQKISLMGLSAEEQAAEISAVFSTIFNDLAGDVVPFIENFQQVGEGLSETLIRVATQVSIADLMVEQMGVTMSDKIADPELYAQIADNISTLVGGVEEFASKTSSFIDAFAPDSVKLDIATGAMNDALNEVGLTIPDSTEGFYNLMNGIDASTEAGQAQIAVLLNLVDTADDYYGLIGDTQSAMADLSDTFAGAVMNIYDISDGITQVSLDAALAAARLGDFSLAESLDTSDYSLDMSDFSSLAEYNVAQAQAANKLLELSKLSASEAGSIDTQQLDELKAINDSIINSIAETNELLKMQNRIQTDSSESLDYIRNVGIEVAA